MIWLLSPQSQQCGTQTMRREFGARDSVCVGFPGCDRLGRLVACCYTVTFMRTVEIQAGLDTSTIEQEGRDRHTVTLPPGQLELFDAMTALKRWGCFCLDIGVRLGYS